MARMTKRIAAAAVGMALVIVTSLAASAQAPVPIRKLPPPPPPAGPGDPAPPAIAKSFTATLHCGKAGIAVNLFSTAGLRCPDAFPASAPSGRPANTCTYVIFEGWAPPGGGSDWTQIDFTCTSAASGFGGFYAGASSEPGGKATFRTVDGTQICTSHFPTTAGWIPQNTELIVREHFPCL